MKVAIVASVMLLTALATPVHAALVARPISRRTIVLVHGWVLNGKTPDDWEEVYGDLRTRLQADGYTVFAPILPYSGCDAGDTIKNATWLRDYITDNHLSNVLLVGHSLGGFVAEYYVRYLDTGEIAAYATLDSEINYAGPSGLACLFNPPDQCAGSALRKAIAAKPARNDIFLLNLWSTVLGNQPQVDCSQYVEGTHLTMVGKPKTRIDLEAEATGVDPCNYTLPATSL